MAILQAELRKYTALLANIAGVEDITDINDWIDHIDGNKLNDTINTRMKEFQSKYDVHINKINAVLIAMSQQMKNQNLIFPRK